MGLGTWDMIFQLKKPFILSLIPFPLSQRELISVYYIACNARTQTNSSRNWNPNSFERHDFPFILEILKLGYCNWNRALFQLHRQNGKSLFLARPNAIANVANRYKLPTHTTSSKHNHLCLRNSNDSFPQTGGANFSRFAGVETGLKTYLILPWYFAALPSCSSMRSNWLYLQIRSVRESEPVFIWPAPVPTARSAIKESSVSPLRWLAIAP